MSGETQKPPCGGFVPGSPRKATTGRYVLIIIGGSGRVNQSLSFALVTLVAGSIYDLPFKVYRFEFRL